MAPSRGSPTAASPRCWRSCETRACAEHFQGVW